MRLSSLSAATLLQLATVPREHTTASGLEGAYLDLLKGALLGSIHQSTYRIVPWYHGPRRRIHRVAIDRVRVALDKRGFELVRRGSHSERAKGHGWPLVGETMVSRGRLDHLQSCIEQVLDQEVPGDLIETGVWRGGSSILMRGVLKARGITDRTVYVADSFRGLPEPDLEKFPADAGDRHHTRSELAISADTVRANFERYGLLDDLVVFLEGWFSDTLPSVRDVVWSVIRLDGDMYGSTMEALTNLYPRLSVGGFLLIDDYALPNCVQAIADFREREGISETINHVDESAWWCRER